MYENHTWIILAYKDSKYMPECVESILNQTVKSKVLISTSTPSEYLSKIAQKYGLDLVVNREKGQGIAYDWNFAYSLAKTQYVTLGHQDDTYKPLFLDRTLSALEKYPDALIAFTDYNEIKHAIEVNNSKMLKIKRLMNAPIGMFPHNRFIRRRILSFGSPIAAPSVTYCRERLSELKFNSRFKTALDYDFYEKASRLKGAFVYIPERLAMHRLSEESATTETIRSGDRYTEEKEMLYRFHPKPIANFILHFYSKAYKLNEI